MNQPALTGQITVPFVDLHRLNEPIRAELLEEVSALVRLRRVRRTAPPSARSSTRSPRTADSDAVGLASGLDALRLALLAAGIRPGDEVIVPAQTFVATLEAVTQAGGTPVPADVGELDYSLDAARPRRRSPRARPSCCRCTSTGRWPTCGRSVARRTARARDRRGRLPGARGRARRASAPARPGSPARSASTRRRTSARWATRVRSTTDDASLAETVRALREHGQRRKYQHDLEGYTAGWTRSRRSSCCSSCPCSTAGTRSGARPRRFLGRGARRRGRSGPARVRPGASRSGTSTSSGRPIPRRSATPPRAGHRDRPPLPAAGPSRTRVRAARLCGRRVPGRRAVAREGLSLPIFPGITEAQLAAVVEAIGAFFAVA